LYFSIGLAVQPNNSAIPSELMQVRPVIDLYPRDLQRAYVKLLVSSLSSSEGASEFRVALRSGLGGFGSKLDQAAKKVRDPQTRAHLKDLRAAIGG
jgi:hypothetical protein